MSRTELLMRWMRIQIKSCKIMPMVLAFFYWLNTILGYFGINQMFISLLSGMSILPLTYLYISSYALGFCSYHRMFLHYIACSELLIYIVVFFGVSISQYLLFVLLMAIAGVFLFVILYQWMKSK